VIIEPSGVGKLSDVIRAVQKAGVEVPMELGTFVTVVNAAKAKVFLKNFGEFFIDQVEHAGAIILSRTQGMSDSKLDTVVNLLREKNPTAPIITTPWEELTGQQIMAAMEGGHSMMDALLAELKAEEDEDEDDDECDDPDCSCHHHHDHDHEHEHHHDHDHDHEHHHDHDHDHEHEHEHEHHHDHDHDHDHDHEHEHEHHHDHDHDHHHHHHHHADEVFTSWGAETHKKYTQAQIEEILEELDLGSYGMVLRAKGILPGEDGQWIHFDFTPNEINVRTGSADYTGRLCVIGSELKEEGLKTLFQL
jgi:G3E family GTPase